MSDDTTYMDPGQCLRCKDEIIDRLDQICCKVAVPPVHWDICRDCWNEMVLFDAQQLERDLSAVNPDGSIVRVKAW